MTEKAIIIPGLSSACIALVQKLMTVVKRAHKDLWSGMDTLKRRPYSEYRGKQVLRCRKHSESLSKKDVTLLAA